MFAPLSAPNVQISRARSATKPFRVGQERGRDARMSVACSVEVWSAAGFVGLLEGVSAAQAVRSVPGKD